VPSGQRGGNLPSAEEKRAEKKKTFESRIRAPERLTAFKKKSAVCQAPPSGKRVKKEEGEKGFLAFRNAES